MENIELYLDGKLVDFGEALTLKLVSNVLSDVDKITCNYSYTGRLPRTTLNDAIMAGAGEASAIGVPTVRKFLRCDYLVDGYPIVWDGKAYITRTTADNYEFSLAWDEIAPLKAMTGNDQKTLPELCVSDPWFIYSWQTTPSQYRELYAMPVWGWAEYATGWEGNKGRLPVVMVRYLLKLIEDYYGVTLNFPYSRQAQIDEWLIALTTRKHYLNNEYPTARLQMIVEPVEQPGGGHVLQAVWYINDSAYNVVNWSSEHGAISPNPDYIENEGKATIVNGRIRAYHATQPFYVMPETPETFGSFRFDAVLDPQTGEYSVDQVIKDVQLETHTRMTWRGYKPNGTPFTDTEGFEIDLDYDLELSGDVEEYQGYRIAPNLPDMTAVAFIKEICNRLGVFAIYTGSTDTITFVGVEELLAKAPKEYEMNNISTLQYRLADWAQHNWWKHSTDNYYSDEGKGEIVVNDETLDLEKTVFTSKFVCGDISALPLYKVKSMRDNNDNSYWGYEFQNNVKQRFGKLYPVSMPTMNAVLSFEGMDFQSLIDLNWVAFAALIYEPLVIQGVARLTSAEANSIDMTRPLYDKLTNRKYLIVSATSGSDNIWTFELIQINI